MVVVAPRVAVTVRCRLVMTRLQWFVTLRCALSLLVRLVTCRLSLVKRVWVLVSVPPVVPTLCTVEVFRVTKAFMVPVAPEIVAFRLWPVVGERGVAG